MGEVYRARDTRLARDVAIKASAERLSDRFEKEAHAITFGDRCPRAAYGCGTGANCVRLRSAL
jgi:hypothetical protein